MFRITKIIDVRAGRMLDLPGHLGLTGRSILTEKGFGRGFSLCLRLSRFCLGLWTSANRFDILNRGIQDPIIDGNDDIG